MATTELIVNIFILIHLLGHAVSDQVVSVYEVHSAILQQMVPDELDDVYLLGKPVEWRKVLCTKILHHSPETEESVLPPKDGFHYVMEAHVYAFDTVDTLALQCPTFPPMYISHSGYNQWNVWLVKPSYIDDYKFTIEAVSYVSEVTNEETLDPKLRLKGHIFKNMNRKKRWHICDEARSLVRYKIKVQEYLDEGPKFYEFTFADERTQIIFATY